MFRKRYATILALLFLAGSIAAGEKRGDGPPDGPRGPGGGRGPGMRMGFESRAWEDIELTDSQKTRLLDAMTKNFRATQEALLERMEERRTRGNADRDRRPPGPGEKGPRDEGLEGLRKQLRNDIESILTADQLKKLDEGSDGRPPRDKKKGGPPPR